MNGDEQSSVPKKLTLGSAFLVHCPAMFLPHSKDAGLVQFLAGGQSPERGLVVILHVRPVYDSMIVALG